mgnify:FL=1
MNKSDPRILLIDDTRDETSPEVSRRVDLIARNYWAGIDALVVMGPWDLLFLDHDLNSFENDREYTGYNIVNFLEDNPHFMPKDVQIVSSNPVGRQRMGVVLSKLYNKRIY